MRPPLAIVLWLPCWLALLPAQRPEPPLTAVPFPDVHVDDAFFAPRRATNAKVTLFHALDQLEQTGTLANFDLAAAGLHEGHRGFVFQDSDAFRALEAVAYTLAVEHDPALDEKFDAAVARIAKAQQADGYLNTAYTVPTGRTRFTNLRDDHELYCAGHLFEAAVAHFQATGKRSLLDVAVRYADLLVRTFGSGDGKRPGYCGHPEVELALVKLAKVTGERAYFELARHFLTTRGSRFFATEHGDDPRTWDGSYWLDHEPIVRMERITGHAVRAAYLMAGATDVAASTGDADLLRAVQRIWRNTIARNVFVTGGIGPSASNEGFTTDHDLPTFTAYQESCASIALVLWARRLALVTRRTEFADAVETALYNSIPAGVQLDGRRFFYSNPLASLGNHRRREWFGCACCPPNLARTFAALPGYVAATSADGLWLDLYVRGEVRGKVSGEAFTVAVETDYPWQGTVTLRIVAAPSRPATLNLRVPGWCQGATVRIGAEPEQAAAAGRTTLLRQWRVGDAVQLTMPMPLRTLVADPRAQALRGRVAFARGPVVYCLEQVDQTVPVAEILAAPGTTLQPQVRPDLLGGVTVLTGTMQHVVAADWTEDSLYRPAPPTTPVAVLLVPYAVWDNRAAGPMAVWLPQAAAPGRVLGLERTATITVSFAANGSDATSLRDGDEPTRSAEATPRAMHFRGHAGGGEWVQYEWPTPQRIGSSEVFWREDPSRGLTLPTAARLCWLDGDRWVPVTTGDQPLAVARDRWCRLDFTPVATTALRLEIDQPAGAATALHRWRVFANGE